MNKYGQSILDMLVRTMPSWKNVTVKNSVDSVAANTLFSLWRTGGSKLDNKTYRKPPTLSKHDVDKMKNAGLVKVIGNDIQITDKGSNVIKTMILGDNRSVFEDDGLSIDYNVAEKEAGEVKTAKKTKMASGWWDRFNK